MMNGRDENGQWMPGVKPEGGGRPRGARNRSSYELREALKARGDRDPAEFLSEIASDENEPKDLRLAAANYLMPYYHSKLGATPVPPDPVFMEIILKNPKPTSIDACVENIALLSEAKSTGKIDVVSADNLITDQKVILYALLDQQKLIASSGDPNREQVIRIEGGLPMLPGTNTIMPNRMNGNGHDLTTYSSEPETQQPEIQEPQPTNQDQ